MQDRPRSQSSALRRGLFHTLLAASLTVFAIHGALIAQGDKKPAPAKEPESVTPIRSTSLIKMVLPSNDKNMAPPSWRAIEIVRNSSIHLTLQLSESHGITPSTGGSAVRLFAIPYNKSPIFEKRTELATTNSEAFTANKSLTISTNAATPTTLEVGSYLLGLQVSGKRDQSTSESTYLFYHPEVGVIVKPPDTEMVPFTYDDLQVNISPSLVLAADTVTFGVELTIPAKDNSRFTFDMSKARIVLAPNLSTGSDFNTKSLVVMETTPPSDAKSLVYSAEGKRSLLVEGMTYHPALLLEAAEDTKQRIRGNLLLTAAKASIEASITKKESHLPFSRHFLISTGVSLFNAFKLQDTNTRDPAGGEIFKLAQSDDKDVGFMMDFALRDRHAWVDDDFDVDVPGLCTRLNKTGAIGNIAVDYEMRLGFVLGGNSKDTFTASKIAGSGDVFLEVALGLPLLSMEVAYTRHTFNLETYGSFVTERSILDIQGTYGVGVGLVSTVPSILKDTKDSKDADLKTPIEIVVAGYFGRIDSPSIRNDMANVVSSKLADFPAFASVQALFSRFELRFPYTDSAYLSFTGIFAHELGHGRSSVDPWSITIGITFPLDNLVKTLQIWVPGASQDKQSTSSNTSGNSPTDTKTTAPSN